MLNLEGRFETNAIQHIYEYTALRLGSTGVLQTPEALALYEQNYIEPDEIRRVCESVYGYSLYEPARTYVPQEIIHKFRDTGVVPVQYLPMLNRVTAVYLPEYGSKSLPEREYEVEILPSTLPYYLKTYQDCYGRHPLLLELPVKILLEMIVSEAIQLGAADITISSTGEHAANIYYNVRKRKIESRRIMSCSDIPDLITYLCIKSPYDFSSRAPKYVDVDLNKDYRGRVVINSKFKGYTLTIRLLPNSAFTDTLDNLSMTEATVNFIKNELLDSEVGLRLIVGATMSGKNTTALAALRQVVDLGRYKIVSVEMPVEQSLPGVEQINAESVEEYDLNIKSLIHQNPDFVYITEIRDATGLSTIQTCNTGKRVLSTLHSNSVADTISRLVDITGLSQDRIIQTLHSIMYQELRRDDVTDTVKPYNRYVRFDKDLKELLYNKSLGEVIRIINEREEGDG